jgi:rRNA processing protein Gar1
MHPIGSVLHISKNHTLVLQLDSENPGKDTSAYNESGQRIGVISEVFGPVKKPYITVKPGRYIDETKLVGKTVYTKQEKK